MLPYLGQTAYQTATPRANLRLSQGERINWLSRFYGFCMFRCAFCNRSIAKGQVTCSQECAEDAQEAQAYSL